MLEVKFRAQAWNYLASYHLLVNQVLCPALRRK